jgi:hypothetical protein
MNIWNSSSTTRAPAYRPNILHIPYNRLNLIQYALANPRLIALHLSISSSPRPRPHLSPSRGRGVRLVGVAELGILDN